MASRAFTSFLLDTFSAQQMWLFQKKRGPHGSLQLALGSPILRCSVNAPVKSHQASTEVASTVYGADARKSNMCTTATSMQLYAYLQDE